MKNVFSKIKDKIEKEHIILIALILISLFPLYIPGFLYTHDGIIHLYRTAGEFQNLTQFDFFTRLSYNMINGYGYGWGIFYPPLSALIPALFMCFGASLFIAEKLFLILASVFAAIFAYKLFKEVFKNNWLALLTASLYILAPYKISQIIVRGSMGEVLLFTFLPLIILRTNKDFK